VIRELVNRLNALHNSPQRRKLFHTSEAYTKLVPVRRNCCGSPI
jgi:hypothetical protein